MGRDDSLWVGGLFPGAGNKAAAGLARWVANPGILLRGPQQGPGGDWQIGLAGVLGLRYRLEATADLQNWTIIGRGAGAGDETQMVDAAAATARFYRAVLEP